VSLRLRLALAVGIVALIALAGADVAVYTVFRSSLLSSVDASLDAARPPIIRQLAGAPGAPGGGNGPPAGSPGAAGAAPPTANTPTANDSFCLRVGLALGAGSVVELRSPTGASVANTACVDGSVLGAEVGPVIPRLSPASSATPATPNQAGPSTHFDAASVNGKSVFRVDESLLANGDTLVLAVPLEATDHSLSRLLLEEVVTSLGALALAIGLGAWLVGVGLRPLRDVERTANAITAGDLTERVPGEDRRTEIGAVARAINTMLRRIEDAFRQRDENEAALRSSAGRLRQFISDASHELRTPIAAVSAYAELFGSGAAAPENRVDLERAMAGIQGEASRMGGLVEDLLLLARLDERRPLERRPIELVALCSEAIRTAAAVGPQWPVRLVASEPVEAFADPRRLRQVIDNLLLNVRSHTPPGTESTVTVSGNRTDATIEVADQGPGFGPSAGRVFERFYRADPSRARRTGGSGLGLAIVASIVESHGGSVTAADGASGGAVVVVVLPLGLVGPDSANPAAV
jgi:two-component system OmpR family sensor kinase